MINSAAIAQTTSVAIGKQLGTSFVAVEGPSAHRLPNALAQTLRGG